MGRDDAPMRLFEHGKIPTLETHPCIYFPFEIH